MLISQLSEIIFEFYNSGRPKSVNTSYAQADMEQFAKLAYADLMRQVFRSSLKDADGADYYFYSSILAIKTFSLSNENSRGVRCIDITAFDTYKLPRNAHITNIYPNCNSCSNVDNYEITQVSPGEENFYLSPDFSSFKFFVVKGKRMDFYNVEPCVKSVDVESTFADGDVDVPLDFCYNVANAVLGRTLGIPAFMNKDVDNPYTQQQANIRAKIGTTPQPQI